jgi:hypothetical protein
MYLEKELINMIENNGLDSYNSTFDEGNMIVIDADLDEIIKFSKKRNIKELFYRFEYANESELLITDDTKGNLDIPYEEIYDIIKPMINEYNDKVSKLDFFKPCSLKIFCIYQGQRIGIIETDYRFVNEDITFPEDALDLIVVKNSDLIKNRIVEKEEESETIRKEFRKYLLNDEKFCKCTNVSLRKNYTMELYNDKEHEKFKEAFISEISHPRQNFIQYLDFVEIVWKEYKDNSKK